MRSPSRFSAHPIAKIPLLAAAVALTLASKAKAQEITWAGSAPTPDWSLPANWATNVAPQEFDTLVFGSAGASGTVLNNDLLEGFLISRLAFNADASAYTLNGNEITLFGGSAGGILNSSLLTQTINLPINLQGQSLSELATFTTTSGGGNIVLGGVLSGPGGIMKMNVGTGTPGVLRLTNTENTYTGITVFGGGVIDVASVSDYGVPSSIGAREAVQETAPGDHIGLHFRGGTLRYSGSTPQSTNRQIRILNGEGARIEASGTTPEATLSFTHSGSNIDLFDTPGARTLTLAGTNTGKNTFSIRLTDQAGNQTALRKADSGTWYILNSDNTHTGELLLEGGILNVASLSDYGAPSSLGPRTFAQENSTPNGIGLHFRGGTLQYTGSTPQSTNREIRILNGNGATIDASGSTQEATLSFTKTGANTNLFDTGGARTLTLTGTNTGENTFSIQLTNQSGNATGLTKSGVGRWILNGPDANTGTGSTTVNGGTLVLGKTNAIAASGSVVIGDGAGNDVVQIGGTGGNQIADTSIVTFNGVGADAGILRLSGLAETVAGIASTGGAGIIENEGPGVGTLTVNVGTLATYSGSIRDGDGVGTDGSLALTKTGAGTLVLSGTTTHSGATAVTGGTLTVNGTLGAGSTVVLSAATLDGVGTIAGTIQAGTGGVIASSGNFTGTVNLGNGSVLAGSSTLATVNANSGSRLSPGGANAVGSLNIGQLTLSSGSVLDFEFGATSDIINITGAGGLAINGGAFNLFATGGVTPLQTNGSYTLLDYTGTFAGSLSNLTIANSQAGKFYSLADEAGTTRIVLTVADASVSEWNGSAADGRWTTSGNWTAGVPNGAGAVARFGAVPAAATSIAVDGAKTVGGMLFDNNAKYTITGGAADTITLNNGVAAATVTVSAGDHVIAAPVVLATSGNAATAANTTLTFSGNISGDRGLIVSGSGTTILEGTNTYSTTTVAGGVLRVGNGGNTGTLGSGDVTIEPNAELVFNRGNDIGVSNNLSGPGGRVTKLGAGTLTLSGTNTFGTAAGGSLNLNGGTVKLASAGALGNGVVLSFNGGTLDLGGNSIFSSFLAGPSGTITDTSAGAGTTVVTVNQDGASNFGGTISNGTNRSVAVVKSGAGALTLSGNNTFTGGLTITRGAVLAAATDGNPAILSNVVLGDGSNPVFLIAGNTNQQFGPNTVIKFDNGSVDSKFQLRGSNQTVAGIDSTADSTVTLAIIQNDEAGTPGFSGNPGPATLTIDTDGEHAFTGLIRNQAGGGLHLVKEGSGTQSIQNALIVTNNFQSITVNEGKLRLNYVTNGSNTNTFATPGGDALPMPIIVNEGGTLSLDGTIVLPGVLMAGETVTSAGVRVSGDGTLLKEGTGTATINSANDFTGQVVLNAGILQVGNDQALGDPSALLVINGGNLRASGATREIPNPVQINGDFTLGRQTNLNGEITLGADATLIADNPDGTYNTTSALGPVSGPFGITVREGALPMGTGAIIFTGENTNTGGTTIASGRVDVSFGALLANAPLVVNGGTLNLNNEAQTVTSFSGAGGRLNVEFPHVLTVNQGVAGTFAGVLAGSGNVIKTGPESLTLSGNSNSFAGVMQVNQGALLVNGAINGSVEVSGATALVGGAGSVASIDVRNGGAINPGGALPGTLSALGNVEMSAGTQLRLDLNDATFGVGYDQIKLDGAVTIDGALLSLGGTYLTDVGTPSDIFFIILNNGLSPIEGTFANLPEGSTVVSSSGQAFRLTYSADADTLSFSGGNDIAIQAIPEPATGAVLLAGAAALLGLRRRRRA